MLHTTFVQIALFDWLTGDIKGKFSKKNFKVLLLSNCKEDEAEIWYTCIGHCPLLKLRFLLRSDKNSDYEDTEEGFAIDLCSKKVLESCAVTHSCLDFFHMYTRKSGFSL